MQKLLRPLIIFLNPYEIQFMANVGWIYFSKSHREKVGTILELLKTEGMIGKSGQTDHLYPVESDHLNPEQTDHLHPAQIDHPFNCN